MQQPDTARYAQHEALAVRVRCDWISGRPRAVRLARGMIPITRVLRIRREAAAHPIDAGPRTLFDVLTPRGRLALVYEHRRRAWKLHGIEPMELLETPIEAFDGPEVAAPTIDRGQEVPRLPWAA